MGTVMDSVLDRLDSFERENGKPFRGELLFPPDVFDRLRAELTKESIGATYMGVGSLLCGRKFRRLSPVEWERMQREGEGVV